MAPDRSWMYQRFIDGFRNPAFGAEIEGFINFALAHDSTERDGDKLKCPCSHVKCRCSSYRSIDDIKLHIWKNGFVSDYYVWSHHGEEDIISSSENIEVGGSSNAFVDMVQDVAGPNFDVNDFELEEPPNPEAQKFFDMLQAAKQPLFAGCEKFTQLSYVARMMNMKSEDGISQKSYDKFLDISKGLVPDSKNIPANFYESKKLLRGMGLPVEKIDCCPKNCMIYWKDDSSLDKCKFCSLPRFKSVKNGKSKRRKSKLIAHKRMYYFPLTPRLQRLYASLVTAKDMRWHAEHVVEDGVMSHPSDSEAWKHFDQSHPEFAAETQNEDYQSTLQSRVASDGDDVDPNEVYLEVVGNQKGRRFGLGCYGKAIKAGSSSTAGYSPDVTQLQTQIQTQQQMLEEQERRMQQMREEQEQRQQQMLEEQERRMLQMRDDQEQRMLQMREEFMQALAAMRQQPPP